MNKKFWAAFMMGAALAAGTPAVSAATVEPVGEQTFLYMNTREARLTEDVSAVDLHNGSLCLMDRNGNRKLTMMNVDGDEGGVGFAVRELRVEGDSGRRYWEILADVGAHGKNCGYWLIAEEHGTWTFMLTTESLASAGYTPQEWHRLESGVVDGRYILTSSHEYMPEGAQFEYERQHAVDWQAELVWSEDARAFLLDPIFPQ
ncbi:MAG: hypothetical protein IJ812_00705 [Schwartzia sp.]|nr:hypothetical protein [Schwartzia sp. (in: firmicutes)]